MNAMTERIGAAFVGACLIANAAAEAQTRGCPEKSVRVVASPDVRERILALASEA